ncbi:DUF6766 family protein [Nonomuraea sp. LPB2021202275-12-8]|uniref:DUF6766 family protein n=1 Tax=Nonomuraea sp. LPB2021202275-12-8 TaxID=3120159 RepID=UPI00300DB1DD
MRKIKDNALSVAFLVLFLLCLAGQGLAGMLHYNEHPSRSRSGRLTRRRGSRADR